MNDELKHIIEEVNKLNKKYGFYIDCDYLTIEEFFNGLVEIYYCDDGAWAKVKKEVNIKKESE